MEKLKYDLTNFLKKKGCFAPIVYLKDDVYTIKYEQNNEEVEVYENSEFEEFEINSLFEECCKKNIKFYKADDLGIRRCSNCGKYFTEGFICDYEYFCSDKCVFECYTPSEYDEMVARNNAYYTEWGTEAITGLRILAEVQGKNNSITNIKRETEEIKVSKCSIKRTFENNNVQGYNKKWTVVLEDDISNHPLGCIASFYGENGQFVSSYYVDTLLNDHSEGSGLSLYLDCPYWTITGSDLKVILNWIKTKTRMCLVA